jgi:hypothetical protein
VASSPSSIVDQAIGGFLLQNERMAGGFCKMVGGHQCKSRATVESKLPFGTVANSVRNRNVSVSPEK